MTKHWVEVEDAFLTNQPLTTRKEGRKYVRVPDPACPPTEAWLFIWNCERTKRWIRRRRSMMTLCCRDNADLRQQLTTLMENSGYVLIATQKRVEDYRRFRGEPTRLIA